MDLPRRALFDEPEDPEDIESYVARRSRGFTPADDLDPMVVRPARAARILEPTAPIDHSPQPQRGDDSPRPRRALFAEPLTPDADEEKSTAAEAGIGRRAMEPLPPAVKAYAAHTEDSVPVRARPAALPPAPAPSPPLTRSAPSSLTAPLTPSWEMARTVPPPAPITVPPAPSEMLAQTHTSPQLKPTQLPAETAYAPPPPAPRPQPRPAARAAEPTERPKPRPSHQPTPRQTAPVAGRRTHATRSRVRHDVPPIIVARLIKSYYGRLAVRDLSFVVQPGRVTGFLGPNGAGKTTTMRILVGLTTPTTGTATFGGLEYAELPHPQRTVGCVLDASFHPARSGRNHLRVLAPTAGASDRRVDKLLEAVGLGDAARQPVGEYSTGMRQRLALAAAMLGNPEYLILDEPANGLDPEGIRWLREFLRDFAARGRAVLISSHLLNEIEAIADDIVVIDRGRLLAQMPMSQLNLGEGTTRARVSDMRAALHALAGIGADVQTAADERGTYLRIPSHDVSQVGSVLFSSGIAVDELITERRDLEQEFFSVLEGSR